MRYYYDDPDDVDDIPKWAAFPMLAFACYYCGRAAWQVHADVLAAIGRWFG